MPEARLQRTRESYHQADVPVAPVLVSGAVQIMGGVVAAHRYTHSMITTSCAICGKEREEHDVPSVFAGL